MKNIVSNDIVRGIQETFSSLMQYAASTLTSEEQTKQDLPLEPAESRAPYRAGFFHARDGTQIYYEVHGKGKPLIMCNGLVCRIAHWRYQTDYFAKKYQIIHFDYRGHYRSAEPKNDQNVTLEWLATDVQNLMNHLEVSEAVLFGHSMGVPVAGLASALEPKRVRAAVFVCGSLHNPLEQMFFTNRVDSLFNHADRVATWIPDTADKLWRKFTTVTPLNFLLTSQLGFNPDTAKKEDVYSYMEGVHQTPWRVLHKLVADYRKLDGYSLLQKIQCPALVVAGEEDCITPMPLQEEITRWLDLGELERIPGGSHNAHQDFPEEVNSRIDAFLARIKYS